MAIGDEENENPHPAAEDAATKAALDDELKMDAESAKRRHRRIGQLKDEIEALERLAAASDSYADQIQREQDIHQKQIQQGSITLAHMKDRLQAMKEQQPLRSAEIQQLEEKIKATENDITAMQRQAQSIHEVRTAAESFTTSVTGVNSALVKKIKAVDNVSKSLKLFGKSVWASNIGARALIGTALKLAESAIMVAKNVDTMTETVRKNLGVGKQFDSQLSRQTHTMYKYGVMADETGGAFQSLYKNHLMFTQLTPKMQRSLTTNVSLLAELGVAADTTTDTMNNMTKGLGFNAKQVDNLGQYLLNVSDTVGKPMSVVAEDFKSASVRMAFHGTRIKRVFEGLEFQSKNTGLSVDKLLDVVGDPFDTFEGAATSVGRLNAILGGPYLNSIDMLNMSEEQRVSTLQRAVKMAGVQIDQLGKFEQMAIANALNTDVDTAMKMLRGMNAEERKRVREQRKLKKAAEEAMGVLTKMKLIFYRMSVTLDPLVDKIESLVDGLGELADKYSLLMGGGEDATKLHRTVGSIVNMAVIAASLWGGKKLLTKGLAAGAAGLRGAFPGLAGGAAAGAAGGAAAGGGMATGGAAAAAQLAKADALFKPGMGKPGRLARLRPLAGAAGRFAAGLGGRALQATTAGLSTLAGGIGTLSTVIGNGLRLGAWRALGLIVSGVKGISAVVTAGAAKAFVGVVGGVATLAGGVYGLVKAITAGDKSINVVKRSLTGLLEGAALGMTKLLDTVTGGFFSKGMKKMTGASMADLGTFGEVFKKPNVAGYKLGGMPRNPAKEKARRAEMDRLNALYFAGDPDLDPTVKKRKVVSGFEPTAITATKPKPAAPKPAPSPLNRAGAKAEAKAKRGEKLNPVESRMLLAKRKKASMERGGAAVDAAPAPAPVPAPAPAPVPTPAPAPKPKSKPMTDEEKAKISNPWYPYLRRYGRRDLMSDKTTNWGRQVRDYKKGLTPKEMKEESWRGAGSFLAIDGPIGSKTPPNLRGFKTPRYMQVLVHPDYPGATSPIEPYVLDPQTGSWMPLSKAPKKHKGGPLGGANILKDGEHLLLGGAGQATSSDDVIAALGKAADAMDKNAKGGGKNSPIVVQLVVNNETAQKIVAAGLPGMQSV